MKKYVFTENGIVKEYPVYESRVQEIIGTPFITIQSMSDAGVYPVRRSEKGSQWNKNYTEGIPVERDGLWYESWVESDASSEEIEQRTSVKWEEIRRLRDRLLHLTDWTQLSDVNIEPSVKLEYQQYRQQLRDITDQSDPFDIWFPEEPNA